jgi:hypothetical protein
MKEGLGLACMPGFIHQASEVTQPRRHIGMLVAVGLLSDRQSALVERPRPCCPAVKPLAPTSLTRADRESQTREAHSVNPLARSSEAPRQQEADL